MTSSSGQYLILKKIAVGGMAEIFLARRVSLGGFGKFVVVKKLAPEFRGKAAFETLFIGEAKLSARLAHGNTIQLYDLGQEDDAYFMVMEYMEHELKALLETMKTPFTLSEVKCLLRQLLEAVASAAWLSVLLQG